MPWLLNTPINVGDLDDGSYNEVKITRFGQDSNRSMIRLRLEYGNTVDDEWIQGIRPKGKDSQASIRDEDYSSIVASSVPDVQTTDPNDAVRYIQYGDIWIERTYYAVKRGLYDWLVAQEIIGPGSMI